MTRPRVARSMPCSVKYRGRTGRRPPNPSQTTNSASEQRQQAAPAVEPGGQAGAERGERGGHGRVAQRTGGDRSVGRRGPRGRTAGILRSPRVRVWRSLHARDRGRGPGQDLQEPQVRGPRPGWRRPDRRGRHRAGSAGTQRRRQDDDGAHPGHAPQAGRRPGHGRRLRRRPAGPAAPPRHRPVRPVRRRRREPDRSREPVDGRPAVPDPVGRGAPPGGRAARAVRPRRRPRTASSRPTRAACAAGWTWAPRSSAGRACSSSTSRRPGWTRARGWACGTSSAGSCARARRSC